jgi:hypothetical protein
VIVSVRSLDAVALECEVMFFVERFETVPVAQNEVFDRVYRHCASVGICLAPPADSALILPPRAPPMAAGEVPSINIPPSRALPAALPFVVHGVQLFSGQPELVRRPFRVTGILPQKVSPYTDAQVAHFFIRHSPTLFPSGTAHA